jgi:hypothetical protein
MEARAQDLLADAAISAIEMGAAGDDYVEVTRDTLRLVGRSMAEEIEPDERAGLFVAALIDTDGVRNVGGLLFLEERVIVGWHRGWVRGRSQVRSHFLDDIRTITSFPDRRRRTHTCVGFSADECLYGVIFDSTLTTPGFPGVVEMFLAGAAKQVPADDSAAAASD